MIHSNFKEALYLLQPAINFLLIMTKRVIILYRLNSGAKISKSYISEAVTLAIAAIPLIVFPEFYELFLAVSLSSTNFIFDTFKEVHTLQQCHRMRMHFHIFYCLSFKCHQILMNLQVMLPIICRLCLLKHN
jgi:hypothetical protein